MKITFALAILMILLNGCSQSNTIVSISSDWKEADNILKRILPPIFPDKVFDITSFGAKGDGASDCTEAFKKAIEECSASGGGKVLVPAGVYSTGAIHLKSNVNLYLEENSIIKFSTDPKKYLPLVFSRWEGVECLNYSALIYAYGQENIAVTGKGILDGQGSNDNWWSWKGIEKYGWKTGMPSQKNGRDKMFQMAEDNVAPENRILGEDYYLRPNLIHIYKSKNVLIQGVTLKNSPMWFINPVLCENVSVIGVTIEGLGPNNDGCNPESCKDVLIKDCFFNTGDDCIAIKSGRNNDGRRINIPSENIVIQNCIMKEGHGGVVFGSEISGGVRNVYVENCTMSSPNLERAIRFKTNSVRGGLIENIYVRNLTVGEVSEAILKIDFYYEEGDTGDYIPVIRNIFLDNITGKKSEYALWIKGYSKSLVNNIHVSNSSFENVTNGNFLQHTENIQFKNVSINNKVIDLK